MRGDVGHLRQILLNLAGNAVKFTDHGRVEIRVSVVQADTSGAVRLRFDILDTGIGVAPAMRARLFDAFEQADVSMARRHEGTGLGTTIARAWSKQWTAILVIWKTRRAAAISGSSCRSRRRNRRCRVRCRA